MSGRCAWCAGAEGALEPLPSDCAMDGGDVAHPEHRAAVCAYAASTRRLRGPFLGVFFGGQFVVVIGAVLVAAEVAGGPWVLGGAVAAMGAALLGMPFATPQTVRAFGIRTARWLARGAGVLLIGVGAWIALT